MTYSFDIKPNIEAIRIHMSFLTLLEEGQNNHGRYLNSNK